VSLEEYLKPLGIEQVEAARRLGISLNRLNEIVLGKRGITADTALRLSRFLKTSPQMWMHLQADWDLQQAVRRDGRSSFDLLNRSDYAGVASRTHPVRGKGRSPPVSITSSPPSFSPMCGQRAFR
jgi:addiction module HigA family antidote